MVTGRKTKKGLDLSETTLVNSLLSKGKKTKISSQKYFPPQKPNKHVSFSNINKKNQSNSQIINNFHKAISSTNSDEVILKMLDLKEKDIVIFYKNLEKLIGKDMSGKIKDEMASQLIKSKNIKNTVSICPFCTENKTNCVILLCGHLLCSKCAKNINRCKYPCPKCKKPIQYIQYIADI
tara:strand:- start:181 stop:720 length:540 start_codon:yes stop_codon:yes gene_type:complete